MDPDANLKELLELAEHLLDQDEPDSNDVDSLCELVQALDGWLSNGGFLPERWKPVLRLDRG